MFYYSKLGFLIIDNIEKGKLYKLAPGFKVIHKEVNRDGHDILTIASDKDLLYYSCQNDFFFQ